MTSFKAEVTTPGDGGKYTSNALRFESKLACDHYGFDLACRWTAVEDVRSVRSGDLILWGSATVRFWEAQCTPPTPKAPHIESRLTDIHGISRQQARTDGLCMNKPHAYCKGNGSCGFSEFKDEASVHEFAISGMCQACQDYTFQEQPPMTKDEALRNVVGDDAVDILQATGAIPMTEEEQLSADIERECEAHQQHVEDQVDAQRARRQEDDDAAQADRVHDEGRDMEAMADLENKREREDS